MRNILLIISLRLKIFLRKPLFILVCLILSLGFYFIIYQVFKPSEAYNRIPIAIVDEDNSTSSREIIKNLEDNDSLSCLLLSRKEAFKRLESNEVEGIYIFVKGLEGKIKSEDLSFLVEVYYSPKSLPAAGLTDIAASEMMPLISLSGTLGTINNIHRTLGTLNREAAGEWAAKFFKGVLESEEFNLPLNIKNIYPESDQKPYSSTVPSIAQASLPGIMILFITLYLFFNAGVFIREERNGIRKRLRAGGFTSFQIVCGDMLGILIIGILISLFQSLMLIPSLTEFALSTLCLLMLINLVYVSCASCLLILITRIVKSPTAFQSMMPPFVFLFGLLGGCIFSVELFPSGLRRISYLFPTYWGQNAMGKVLLYGGEFVDIGKNMLILLGITIVLFWVSLILERRS